MTVNAKTPSKTYTAAAGATVFPYDFRIFTTADLYVSVDGSEKTLSTHYTVSGADNPGGGNVTFLTPMVGGEVVVIAGDVSAERDTDYQEGGDLLGKTHNDDHDYPIMLAKQIISRAMMIPVGDQAAGSMAIGTAAARANKLLGFGADGTPAVYDVGSGGVTDAANVNFLQAGTGALSRTVRSKLRDRVSVLDFISEALHAQIAAGTYTSDLSAQVQHAIDTGKRVFFPKGTYYFNVTATIPFQAEGEGTEATTFKPYDYTLPIINYKLTANTSYQWAYHAHFFGIGFEGTAGTEATSAGGVGFSVGVKNPATFTTNDSFIGYVTFENCRFRYLYKGVQRPSGNLAFQFINCNVTSCYYGVYSVQGKGFPPGQLFFHEGEISSNLVGVYVDCQQAGLGQIAFDGVVFESNSICVRAKASDAGTLYTPIMFRNCWNEANGPIRVGDPGTVTIDLWSGTGAGASVTTEVITTAYPYVLDVNHSIFDGGFVTGVHLMGTDNVVYVRNARVEQSAGYGASAFITDDGTSFIYFDGGNVSVSGFGNSHLRCIETGQNQSLSLAEDASNAAARARNLPAMKTKTKGIASGVSQTFETSQTLTEGGGTVRTGVATADGVIFPYCNRFSYNSNTGNITSTFSNASFVAAAKYTVCTVDIKVVSGAINFYAWDGANKYVFAKLPPADSRWHTYGGISLQTGTPTMYLGTLTQDVSPVALDFSVSALQFKQFDSYHEALDFLNANTYMQDDVWTPLTYANSWVNEGGGSYQDGAFMRDVAGNVCLRGMIKSGTATPGTTMFTLPVGFRPGKAKFIPVASNTAFGCILVNTDGTVTIQAGSNTWLSLEGVTFRAA